jgi:drug/metabolite transporter (DMT)-like permease
VTAVIGGMVFLHESMSVNKLIGCILILGAGTVLSILDNKKN